MNLTKKQLIESVNKLPQEITMRMLTEATHKKACFWHYQRRAGKIKYCRNPTLKLYTFQKEDVISWANTYRKPASRKTIIPIEKRQTWWSRVKGFLATLWPK